MRGLKFRGRPPISYAESVKSVVNLTNPYAKAIMDRSAVIDEDFVDAILAQSVLTWAGRNPSPALDEDGNFIGTDLDLMSFLFPLAERGAVIEFPSYRTHRAPVVRPGERRISSESRFGPLVGMTSNQKFFSLSTRMVDNSVIVTDGTGKEKPGAYRNFMVVGPQGNWHGGWDRIVFNPTAEENKFLTEKDLWTGNSVVFKYDVHPNRWQSVFSATYFLLKMLDERLTEEAKYYYDKAKELLETGIEYPSGEGPQTYSGPSEPSGVQQEDLTVTSFEAILDLPEFVGKYPDMPKTQAGLVMAYERGKLLRFTLKPKAQVMARINELAYFKYSASKGERKIASWMTGRSFNDFKPPKGRTLWQQMVLAPGVSYRWRLRELTDKVAVDFRD